MKITTYFTFLVLAKVLDASMDSREVKALNKENSVPALDTSNKNPGQLSNLRGVTHYLTGHDERTGKAIIKYTREGNWTRAPIGNDTSNVPYTTSEFPVSMNNDKDIIAYDEGIASHKFGLSIPNGTVCRMLDLAPQSNNSPPSFMHRSQSIDYGVVLEGSVELVMGSGETALMHRGDVTVQRGTLHGYRNPSEIEWARMFFVLVYSQKVIVAGKTLEKVPNSTRS